MKSNDSGRTVGRLARLIATLLMLALMGAACGADSETASDAGSSEESETSDESFGGAADAEDSDGAFEVAASDEADEAMEEEVEAPLTPSSGANVDEGDDSGADGPLGAGGASVTPTAADLGRKLIFTAVVDVAVDDVAAASAEATSIVESLGGFLFQQNTAGGSQARSELTFKILPDDFNRALEMLGTVGELRNQSVTTDDVTERIVDLGSRIQVAELGVDRLRLALEGSASLEDYAEIERLLLDRESSLEVMRGQLRTLQDRVDLSTITLILTQDRVENAINVNISTYREADGGVACPGREGQNTVEADSTITICFDVINFGDQTLTDIRLTDTVLGIDENTELISVFGTLDELAPGQSALVAYEITPERNLRLRTKVVAIPTDGVSPEQTGPSVTSEADYNLQTFEAESDPGFGDGFSVAVSILKGIWIGLTWFLGFILPLLILLPLVWLAWFAWKAMMRRRPDRPEPLPLSQPNSQPTPDSSQQQATPSVDPAGNPLAGPAGSPLVDPDEGLPEA
ncbi:MAG: DUF4349 domain-containing protein [Acidimicrobiales bacterium]